MWMMWNIPLATSGQLSQIDSLPIFLGTSSQAECEARKKCPCLRTSTTQQNPKHRCVINTTPILNPNHSPGTTPVNSALDETRTTISVFFMLFCIAAFFISDYRRLRGLLMTEHRIIFNLFIPNLVFKYVSHSHYQPP